MDEQAFHAIYAVTARPLWAYLARMSGRADVANDLLQETYCRFLAAQAERKEGAEVKPYLFRIATNLLHDRRRKENDRLWRELPERGFEQDLDTQIDVHHLLRQLKPRERELLWLAYVEGMTHREIAASTGLRPMSVRILLFRARQRVVELLGRKEKVAHEV